MAKNKKAVKKIEKSDGKIVPFTKDQVSTEVVVASLEKQAKPLEKKLMSYSKITTQEDYDTAAALMKQLKELSKQADEKEKEITEPLKGVIKKAIALFKPFKDKVASTEVTLKLAMSIFVEGKKATTAKLEQQVTSGKIGIAKFTEKTAELSAKSSFVKERSVKVLVIEDIAKIPREYMVPDEVKIKKALKMGMKVSGCKLEEQISLAI